MQKEKEILITYLKSRNRKITKQRLILLDFFLKHEKHLSPQEIYHKLREVYPNFGWATVYRTLKLFSDAQLATSITLGDGKHRYEHKFQHPHHDHIICSLCKKTIEFFNPKIEELQRKIARKYKFKVQRHTLKIYGVCQRCQKPGI